MEASAPVIGSEQPRLREVAVLVRLVLPHDPEPAVEESLAEMRRLAATAGADVACVVVQRRSAPNPGTLLGPGKIEEIKALCDEFEAGVVLFDGNLTPKQGARLEGLLERKVMDRTQLILDIFAQHAHTSEGKHQVELAQLTYALPRLAGRGAVMRQQGGIGVRGPGEQKLEVDRRVIRRRIRRLSKELEQIRKSRLVRRKKRVAGSVATVALVGYTNAGKSSLLNAFTGSDLLVKNELFATLDPRSRRCTLPSGRLVVLTDTVGFIRDLPHTLVDAFRATLEEINDADLILLVADASHPAVEERIRAVYQVLAEIKVSDKEVVTVLNKTDVADPSRVSRLCDQRARAFPVSARSGEGLVDLLEEVDSLIGTRRSRVLLRIPQSEARLVAEVHDRGRVIRQEYEGNEIVLDAEIDDGLEHRLAEYVT